MKSFHHGADGVQRRRIMKSQQRSRTMKYLAMMVTMLLAGSAMAAAEEPPELNLWNDPGFRQRFLGSYAVNQETEPRVSSVEREKLEKVLEFMSAEEPEKARAFLEKQTGEASTAMFDFTLANVCFQLDDLGAAVRHYEAAVEKLPSFLRAQKNLGMIYVRNGEYEKALKPLSEAIALGAGDGLTFGLLGYAYMSVGEQVPAETAYRRAVLLQPDTVDWKLGLAQSLFKQEKYEESAALASTLIGDDPERKDFWLLQANAYLGMKQPLQAARNFEYLRMRNEADVRALNTLGDIYVNEKMLAAAAEVYLRALESEPGQPVDRPLRNAEVLAARGALEESKRLIGRVREVYGKTLADERATRLLKLEARIAVAEGRGGKQAEILEQVVERNPTDGDALVLLGRHYASEDQAEKAIFYFERAEKLEEFEAEAKLHHGQLLVRQSRFEKALPLLRRAQRLDPREDVQRYIEQVERIARSRG
ncbi:tetratricopeptide repeat protein [Kiritimatiella glycovorans]|uniref:Tetratricopeptide repeat domain protein n=1 Tax=Kiritimatiella glycovorans TaxID=1307763 RepID=A0A0G3EL16_9BACT|nr:tetratricopeptide repeat protein [Kiritimatiella glycovorans]AKJ65460.1 Tetratricopeptide repeat domain protein [Kiritimatiella glycovorans]